MWRTKKKDELQINLTPMIDVVFLLLIFFMVSTSFKKETKISLDLPEATGEQLEQNKDVVEISINQAGDIFINGEGLINSKTETLQKAIQLSASDNTTPIVINADKAAPYQAVITVMDAAGKVGFNNLTLATQLPKETKE